VATSAADRTGLLVIRVWLEGTSPHELRARITTSDDLTSRDHTVAMAGTIDDVERIVAAWLRAFSSTVEARAARG
jgi:hypothetical protein